MRLAVFLAVLALSLATSGIASPQESSPRKDEIDRAMDLMAASDWAAARRLVEPLAKTGHGEAMNIMAMLLENDGPDWKADPVRAAEVREAAISAGSQAAAVNVALRALIDPSGDHKRAIELLRQADSVEPLRAATTYAWARAYLFGRGVERDLGKGTAYLQQAVKLDPRNMDVQFLLARSYQNGWGIKADATLAYRHMRIAAEAGDERAQWHTGMMLLNGAGVAQDEQQAYRFVKLSAEAGYTDGMISHAVMLAIGQGVAENDVEARRWYFEAAKKGSAHALRGFGTMLVIGEGGPPDPANGFAMLELAASAGEATAAQILKQLQSQAEPDRAAVNAARAEWLAAHGGPDSVN